LTDPLPPSIIISGPPAVGKTTLAKTLAAEFGLRYISGGDMLKEMASEMGFDPAGDDWWDTPEGMKFLSEREGNHEFDRRLDIRLIEEFLRGGVVVTSYTLPWLIKEGATGIKIWLDGSHASSTRRMQSRDRLTVREAYEITRRRYDKNCTLYKEIYGFDFGADDKIFDVIIPTDDLTAGQVVEIARNKVSEICKNHFGMKPV